MSLTTNLTKKALLTLGAGALVASMAASPATAGTTVDDRPETPENNKSLPIVHTTNGSDKLKANALNPHPVCNAWEDKRTVVYEVKDSFLPVGTISTKNETDHTIPLTQNTSKSQTISISVNGSRTESLDVNAGGTKNGENGSTQAGIAYSLATTIGGDASYSLSWEVGQQIGPYDVPAGHTGEATYGFRAINMKGTQQYCKLDGTWSTPTAWRAFTPIKNEVRVKNYANPADSY
ncbi:hypothetical protein M3A96_08090 [Helcobacillus massiliensis]|uniref:hypothetical protein n=1 Tax=Helcobacillus massiliensis TaxID=521392 RepID=UPI0021A355F4|nr:hypothetical protein [Helcobacillus massiliensis]MCT1558073.1 hypothetical protein [Helcobacillus massiliensis]MCT2036628.1 hypothetical protein [Helcobacillus massiliensis]MCT2332498.1 hypothetical protein [Helcobacillus massiliensis]